MIDKVCRKSLADPTTSAAWVGTRIFGTKLPLPLPKQYEYSEIIINTHTRRPDSNIIRNIIFTLGLVSNHGSWDGTHGMKHQ